MSTASRFLSALQSDPDERAQLVEALRHSAAQLDGTDPTDDPVIRERVRHKLARKLRTAAARLCDHARVEGDVCRYCEAVIPEERV